MDQFVIFFQTSRIGKQVSKFLVLQNSNKKSGKFGEKESLSYFNKVENNIEKSIQIESDETNLNLNLNFGPNYSLHF